MKLLRLLVCLLILLGISVESDAMVCKRIMINPNKPISQQITREKAIYIVRDDVDLKGETLVFPNKSTIRFAGGSLCNGTIIGNNTKLSGDVKCYTDIGGTYKNKSFKAEWFNKSTTNLSEVLNKIIATNVNDIIIGEGNWRVFETVYLKSNLIIRGEKNTVITIDREKLTGPFSLFRTDGTVLKFDDQYKYANITIKDLTVDENGSNSLGKTSAIYLCNAENVAIKNCRFIDHQSDSYANYVTAAVTLYNCYKCTIKSCYTEYVRLSSMGFCVKCTAAKNKGYNSPGTWLESCDGCGLVYEWNELHENLFPGNSSISQNSKNGIIRNNTIIVNGKMVDSMINIGHPTNEVYENSGDGCVIEGNVIKTNASKGIIVWGSSKSKNVVIKNNYIYSKSKHAIYVSEEIPSITIVNNKIIGHDENQVLLYIRSNNSVIQKNSISTSTPGVSYVPIRISRSDMKGTTRIEKNIIDNGGKVVDNNNESNLDIAVDECLLEKNTIKDGIQVKTIKQ